MFNFFWQSMHVTSACVLLFLTSAKTGNTGIVYITNLKYQWGKTTENGGKKCLYFAMVNFNLMLFTLRPSNLFHDQFYCQTHFNVIGENRRAAKTVDGTIVSVAMEKWITHYLQKAKYISTILLTCWNWSVDVTYNIYKYYTLVGSLFSKMKQMSFLLLKQRR